MLRGRGLATTPQQASAVFWYTARQFFCVISPDPYAGTSACYTFWAVVSSFMECLYSEGTTGRCLVRDCTFTLSSNGCKLSTKTATSEVCTVLAPGCSRLGCCNQALDPPSAGPDISLLSPELQQQWHHANNQHLGDRKILAGCRLHVWWSCDQCPCTLPHEWSAAVTDRQNQGHKCPFCTNMRLCQHNSLLTVAPDVAKYWDTAKNGLTPDQVTARSTMRRHWLCPLCGHTWQAKPYTKVDSKSGCPRCSNGQRPYDKLPSLTGSKHPAMKEFDFGRNKKAGLDPDKITEGSGKKVHWICANCPAGQPHMFMATPHARIGRNNGCPCCANRKACVCNSLESLYPALAAEYDTSKNGVGPEQVLPRSHKVAFWKDASGHTWEQTPHQRTAAGKGRSKRASIRLRHKQQAQRDLP